jgi:hypothetical protein
MPAPELSVHDRRTDHAVPERKQNVIEPLRRPHAIARRRRTRVDVGERRRIERQSHQIRDARPLQVCSDPCRRSIRVLSGRMNPSQPNPNARGPTVRLDQPSRGIL